MTASSNYIYTVPLQKIVIQVQNMGSDKSRSKAMQIAAVCQGVQSVAIEGESGDQVVVTGDGIDSVCLTYQLRKKFRGANIVSVGDVKANDDGENKPPAEEPTEIEPITYSWDTYPPPCPPYYVYDPYPRSCFFF